MDNVTFSLNLAVDREQSRAEHDAPLLLEQRRPDDDIDDPALVLERGEHDTLGGSRPLPNEHQSRRKRPSSVRQSAGFSAGDDTASAEIRPQERHGMLAQG